MLRHSEKLGRKIRMDSPPELGIATYHLVEQSIGTDPEAAKAYFSYMRREFIIIYTFMVQWSADLVGYIAGRWGPKAKQQVSTLTYPAYREHRPEQFQFLDPNQQERAIHHIERFLLLEEDPESLGADHEQRFDQAVDEREEDRARFLLEDLWKEYLYPHDVVVTRIHDLLTYIAQHGGEDSVPDAVDLTYQKRWKDRYSLWDRMTAEEQLQLSVEGMRGHLSGQSRKGDVIVEEEPDRYVMRFDPCGSGGVLKRGDPATGAAPYPTEGVNREPHPWTWSTTGVHWYSSHCPMVMEWKTNQDWGYPMRPIKYDHDPSKPCTWFIYKDPGLTRKEHYEKMGLVRIEGNG
jgi:hypothetical protein